MPISRFNEQVPLVMHYSVRELATTALLCEKLMLATYCFDIQTLILLKIFQSCFCKVCTVYGEIKLPSLGVIIKLLSGIHEKFSRK